jgi:anti-sigma factor RsiW
VNDCSNLREQLEDYALGGAVTPELSRHLAECEPCVGEFERQQSLVRRIDAAVDTLVRAEQPLQRPIDIASTRRTAKRAPASPSALRRWPAALGVAAMFALIVSLGYRSFERAPTAHSELTALTSWRSPTDSLLELQTIAPHPQPTPGATHES